MQTHVMMSAITLTLLSIAPFFLEASAFQNAGHCATVHHHSGRHVPHQLHPLHSIVDPTLLEELAVSGTVAVVASSIVERTGLFEDLVKDEPTMDEPSSLLVYGLANCIDDAAWVYFLLTLTTAICTQLNVNIVDLGVLKEAIPPISVTVGIATTFSSVKRTLLLQRIKGKTLGRTRIFDQFVDFVLIGVTAAVILSQLELDTNIENGFKNVFAVSGFGALFFSLVVKDLAEEIVGGLGVQLWDAFQVGENIKLGSGLSGKVVSIGLVETEIASGDVITKIPNSQIVNERVSNISRATISRLSQTLRFSYTDIDKIPKVLADIKGECF